jgi:type I restriction enzyme, S subunit
MDTLIGTVPDQWRQVNLRDICEILAGPSGARPMDDPGSKAAEQIVTPKDITDGRLSDVASAWIYSEVAVRLARYKLALGDIVCVRTGELGRHTLVSSDHAGLVFSNGLLRLRSRQIADSSYLSYYLSHPAVRVWMERSATGSVIPTLSATMLGSLPVVVPPDEVQANVAEVLDALNQKIIVHEKISKATAELRDTLLPLLITGSLQPAVAEPAG